MDAAPPVCFDRSGIAGPSGVVPLGRRRPSNQRRRPAVVNDARTKWPTSATIRVKFLDGTSDEVSFITTVADTWTRHANLRFVVSGDDDAEVRVSLDPTLGSWSWVGNQSEGIPHGTATLNLAWVDEAVVLHEFGHAIGLGHEHQNPVGGLAWNDDAVIEAYAGPPNFWDEETTRANVLDPYARTDFLLATNYDPDSIMVYEFPAAWLRSGRATTHNERLSPGDIAFIGGPDGYPGARPSPPGPRTRPDGPR